MNLIYLDFLTDLVKMIHRMNIIYGNCASGKKPKEPNNHIKSPYGLGRFASRCTPYVIR